MEEISVFLKYDNTFVYRGVDVSVDSIPVSNSYSYLQFSLHEGSKSIDSYGFIKSIDGAVRLVDAYKLNFPMFNHKDDFLETTLFYKNLDAPDIAHNKPLYKVFYNELEDDDITERERTVLYWMNSDGILMTITRMESRILKRRFCEPDHFKNTGYNIMIFKNRLSVYRGYFYNLEEETLNELKEVINTIC